MARRTSPRGPEPLPVDYDLTCWYLNARRVIELVGARNVSADISNITAIANIDDALRASMVLSVLKDSLTD